MLLVLFQELFLWLIIVLIWNFLTIFFHELGHFLCAKLVGITPVLIVIGRNIIFKTRFFFNSVVMIGIIPVIGITYIELPVLEYWSSNKFEKFKFKYIIFCLGGVLGNFTLLLIIYYIYLQTQHLPLVVLIFAEVYIISSNIIPREVELIYNNRAVKFTNDGKQISFLIMEDYDKYYARISYLHREEISKLACDLVYKYSVFNNNFNQLRILENSIGKLAADKFEQVIEELTNLLHFSELSTPERAYILDYVSFAVITQGKKHYLHQADKWSEEAVSLAGHSPTVQSTRGMVLVELGEYIEGQRILMEILPSVKEITKLIFINCYLAQVDYYLGNLEEAKRKLKTAKKYSGKMIKTPGIIKETEVAISSRKN